MTATRSGEESQRSEEERRSAALTQGQVLASALNLIAADQAVLRLTLQYLILNAFGAQPDAAQKLLSNMRRQVVESIGRMPLNEKAPQNRERAKRLHIDRAEQLFQELEKAVKTIQSARVGSDATGSQEGQA